MVVKIFFIQNHLGLKFVIKNIVLAVKTSLG
jgi:hypothetical protein